MFVVASGAQLLIRPGGGAAGGGGGERRAVGGRGRPDRQLDGGRKAGAGSANNGQGDEDGVDEFDMLGECLPQH
jgi:hypothetical protein